ncbi:cytochrome P450 2U1-like protein, partial [Leptotrombidium deliense]
MTEGEEWSIHSKFGLGHLSKLGMGKTEFEITMHNIFEGIEQHIDHHNGKPYDYTLLLTEYTINVITSLLCSKSYTHEDTIFVKLERIFRTIFSVLGYMNMHLTGNIFKYYVKLTSNYDKIATNCQKEFRSVAETLVQEREATFDENNCKDLLDYYMKE